MQFHPIVASIFSKTCVKEDHEDSSDRLLERGISLGALVSGFVNISVYLNKFLMDRFLKKFNILLVIRAEY